jgi:hypothetical protein
MFAGSDYRYVVLVHQTADSAVPDAQTNLFQLFGHPWPTITLQAQAMLLSNVG